MLKYVYQDLKSDYECLLNKHGHCTPSLRRRQIALETFKIINGMSPLYLQELLMETKSKYDTRYSHTLHEPRTKTVKTNSTLQYGMLGYYPLKPGLEL